MNMWNMKAVMKDQRFVNYRLTGTPFYKLKVGDEIVGIGIQNKLSGVFRIHSIMFWPMTLKGRKKRVQVKFGAKGFGETTADIDDTIMLWKATRIDNETNTKTNQVPFEKFVPRTGFRGGREKWHIPRHGISSAPR